MIQYGIVKMDSVYAMLGPDDETIVKESEKEFSEARDFVKSMNILSTKEKVEEMDVDGDDGKVN